MIKKKYILYIYNIYIYILLLLFSKDASNLLKVTVKMFIINAILFAVSPKKCNTRCENPASHFFLLFAIFYKKKLSFIWLRTFCENVTFISLILTE